MEPTTQPDGLIQESKNNNYPVIHVSINYRLGGKLVQQRDDSFK